MKYFTSLITFIFGFATQAVTINISNKVILSSESENLILAAQNESIKYLTPDTQVQYFNKDLYIYDMPEESLKNFVSEIQKYTNIKIELVDPINLKLGSQDDMM